MAILTAIRDVTPAQLKLIVDDVIEKLKARAAAKGYKVVVVYELLPHTHLGIGQEYWKNSQALTADTWTKEIDHELDEDEFVVFIGGFNLTDDPKVTGFRFKVGANGGGGTRDIALLDKLYAEDRIIWFYKEPIFYDGKETVYIEYYQKAAVAAGAETIGHIALIAKKYGEDMSAPLPS